MNVVRFFYKAQYLLVLDRHMMCPVPMEEIGQKGAVKLGRVPTAGLSSAERSKVYRITAITVRSGYRRM
jgi:hypothetical protein